MGKGRVLILHFKLQVLLNILKIISRLNDIFMIKYVRS